MIKGFGNINIAERRSSPRGRSPSLAAKLTEFTRRSGFGRKKSNSAAEQSYNCTVVQKHYIVGQTRGWLLQDNRCLSPRSSHIAIWWNNRELFLKRFQETPRVWIKIDNLNLITSKVLILLSKPEVLRLLGSTQLRG